MKATFPQALISRGEKVGGKMQTTFIQKCEILSKKCVLIDRPIFLMYQERIKGERKEGKHAGK